MNKTRLALCAASLALASGLAHAWLAEFGIEGMGVVSTAASEVRATISPDGRRIVWGSTDRTGGAGGWDLWQATLKQGRWQDARPLPINSKANDFDPAFSANGRWLYFFSNRDGGFGGDDLYRAAVREDGGFGAVENLGSGVNSKGDERAPALSLDGKSLLFASDGFGGAGRHDLFVARWNGGSFADRVPVPGVNSKADDFDAAWLDGGKAIVFARSQDAQARPIRLYVAHCDGKRYGTAEPLALSFNSAEGTTLAPLPDWSKPGELLLSGRAKAPSAGKLDIYRMKAPATRGRNGCL